jgi:AcrR family transcriptional regulator
MTESTATNVNPNLRRRGIVLGPRANRTIAAILDAARHIFLVSGYTGTTIDDITRAAGVSRASFYTYFPSKRDVLLTLGADSLNAGMEMARALSDIPADWTIDDLAQWVDRYFRLLDEHGSFAFAWTQAAHRDEEIREAGQRGHLELCRRLGRGLASLGQRKGGDYVETGLLMVSMLERGWSYAQLYAGTVERASLERAAARMLAAVAEGPVLSAPVLSTGNGRP